MSEFFLSYRRIAMTDDEVLVKVHIPLPSTSTNRSFLRSYKQARRRDDDIGIVSAGLHVELEPVNVAEEKQQWRIVCVRLSFGGMGPTTILAKQTQRELHGQMWTKTTIDRACELALKEMPLDERTPGGQPEYRYEIWPRWKLHRMMLAFLDEPWCNRFSSNFTCTFVHNCGNQPWMPKNYPSFNLTIGRSRMASRRFQSGRPRRK